MPLKEAGVLLLVLAAIFVFGNLWFHLVETVLKWLKRPFTRCKKPQEWHPLPKDEENR